MADKIKTLLILVVVAVTLNVCCTFDLTILHTNDIHARIEQFNAFGSECKAQDALDSACFGGEARRLTKVNEIRSQRPNVLLLDAGDRFLGTLWFTQYQGLADSFFMNRFPYDAMCLGNHEFDNGVEGLVSFLNNITVPVVSANTDVTQEPRLQGLFTKSVIKSVGGEDIGIVGYTTPDTSFISNPGPTVTFHSIVGALQNEVDYLKSQGVNKIIALGHAGYAMDQTVARNVNGVDIVVGGHTDTFLYTGDPPSNEEAKGPYPTVVTNPSGGTTLVVQDFTWAKYLGELDVVFSENGEVVSYSGNPILLDSSVPEDPDTKALVDEWAAALDELKNKEIGDTLVYLDGQRSSCRLKECNLGNLITDAMVDFHTQFALSNTSWAPAAIALLNGGGIRDSIVSGTMTLGNVLQVLPFENDIDLITVKGSTLLKALERSVEDYDPAEQKGGFLQMSGIHVTYDISRPALQRVVSASVRCLECAVPSYSPLDEDQEYSILLSEFLIGGGDGYSMFTDELLSREIFSSLDSDVLATYIEKHSPVYPEVEKRISFQEQRTRHRLIQYLLGCFFSRE